MGLALVLYVYLINQWKRWSFLLTNRSQWILCYDTERRMRLNTGGATRGQRSGLKFIHLHKRTKDPTSGLSPRVLRHSGIRRRQMWQVFNKLWAKPAALTKICMYKVLLHNGGFYNTCTLKRCLHRKGDFKTNATYNYHVSQLFPLQSRIVTKGLYYFIISDQNKLVEMGCSHKKCLLNFSPFWTDSSWEQSHLKTQLFSFPSINCWRC